jgi:hypothetical protein
VGRVGLFDPEVLPAALFDETVVQEGWFDTDLIQTAAAPPAAPAALVAIAGVSRVTLSWTAVPGAINYRVYRSLTSGFGYVLIQAGVTATTTIDFAATNGTQYFYVIAAYGPGGEGPYSPEAFATPFSGATVPHVTLYDFDEMRAQALANIKDLDVQVNLDLEAPIGVTDLDELVAEITELRLVLVYSENDSPFQVDLGAGMSPTLHTLVYMIPQHSGPFILNINCPAPSSIRMVIGGDL